MSPSPTSLLPDARIWLVDGFNLLHTVLLGGESRVDWWNEANRQRVVSRVEGFVAAAGAENEPEVWVVFDGHHGDRSHGEARVHVVFADSADAWLVDRVRRAALPGELAVVSADGKVRGRCRHAGAHVVSPRDFLAHCPATESNEPAQAPQPETAGHD